MKKTSSDKNEEPKRPRKMPQTDKDEEVQMNDIDILDQWKKTTKTRTNGKDKDNHINTGRKPLVSNFQIRFYLQSI